MSHCIAFLILFYISICFVIIIFNYKVNIVYAQIEYIYSHYIHVRSAFDITNLKHEKLKKFPYQKLLKTKKYIYFYFILYFKLSYIMYFPCTL